jgi:hypothetical protein
LIVSREQGDTTMRGPIIAGWLENIGQVEKILAILGGAVVGGLLVGFLTGLLVRLVSTRKMPRWARNVVRLTGAVLSGWLVALILFGGDGLGIGGSGGWGFGSGTGKGTSSAKAPEGGGPPTTRLAPEGGTAAATIQVEVLGPAAREKLPGKPDDDHCYRVEVEGQARLMTLGEVKDLLRERARKDPPLRHVRLVLYKDSPTEQALLVKELKDWAESLETAGKKVQVDLEMPATNAPTR